MTSFWHTNLNTDFSVALKQTNLQKMWLKDKNAGFFSHQFLDKETYKLIIALLAVYQKCLLGKIIERLKSRFFLFTITDLVDIFLQTVQRGK